MGRVSELPAGWRAVLKKARQDGFATLSDLRLGDAQGAAGITTVDAVEERVSEAMRCVHALGLECV